MKAFICLGLALLICIFADVKTEISHGCVVSGPPGTKAGCAIKVSVTQGKGGASAKASSSSSASSSPSSSSSSSSFAHSKGSSGHKFPDMPNQGSNPRFPSRPTKTFPPRPTQGFPSTSNDGFPSWSNQRFQGFSSNFDDLFRRLLKRRQRN